MSDGPFTEFSNSFLVAAYFEVNSAQRDVDSGQVLSQYDFRWVPGWPMRAIEHFVQRRWVDSPLLAGGDENQPISLSASGLHEAERLISSGVRPQRVGVTIEQNLIDVIAIPAADRIVRLSHNQQTQADDSVSEIILALESASPSPEKAIHRHRLLGQLRAARELIRVGEYRAYLMYELLVKALGELITKYGDPTINRLVDALLGAVAAKLLESGN